MFRSSGRIRTCSCWNSFPAASNSTITISLTSRKYAFFWFCFCAECGTLYCIEISTGKARYKRTNYSNVFSKPSVLFKKNLLLQLPHFNFRIIDRNSIYGKYNTYLFRHTFNCQTELVNSFTKSLDSL